MENVTYHEVVPPLAPLFLLLGKHISLSEGINMLMSFRRMQRAVNSFSGDLASSLDEDIMEEIMEYGMKDKTMEGKDSIMTSNVSDYMFTISTHLPS